MWSVFLKYEITYKLVLSLINVNKVGQKFPELVIIAQLRLFL